MFNLNLKIFIKNLEKIGYKIKYSNPKELIKIIKIFQINYFKL